MFKLSLIIAAVAAKVRVDREGTVFFIEKGEDGQEVITQEFKDPNNFVNPKWAAREAEAEQRKTDPVAMAEETHKAVLFALDMIEVANASITEA